MTAIGGRTAGALRRRRFAPRTWRIAACALAAALGFAAATVHAEVTVSDAWVELPKAGADYVRVFMTLESDRDLALENAASPVAGIVQLQRPVRDGNVEAMRSIDDLTLPAGRKVELKAGGHQIALYELKKPLVRGQKVPLTLTFVEGTNRRTRQSVMAEVRPASR